MAPSRASTEAPATGADRKWSVPQPGERLAVWTLWFTYGMFYFCRSNLSVAVPGMKAPIAEGGLGYSSEQIGLILASLKISYGVGQLVNGQLSERISPRVLLAAGMFGSAALNVIFGLSTGLYFLLFVWACNGYCQSLGWTPCMRVVSNWVPVLRRGRAIGLIGTGYQITMGLTYVVASWAADRYGWRGALFIPSIMLATAGLAMLMLLRESPEDAPEPAAEQPAAPRAATTTVRENLFLTLFNPALWLLGASLGLLNACRYGFLDWGVAHLMEIHGGSKAAGGLTISGAGLSFGFIAFGAAAGVYLTGWATDRFFGGRRAPMIVSMLVPLGLLALIYHQVAVASLHGAIALLVVIGFCIFGPQVLLVGTAPADLAHRRTAAAAAGFVNFMGYLGAAAGDIVTGYFSDESRGGWQVAIWIWAGWAFAAAACAALLWNATEWRLSLLPRFVPKAVGGSTLALGGAALWSAGSPAWGAGVAIASAALLAGAAPRKWGAGASLVAATMLLALLFAGQLPAAADASPWPLVAAKAGCAIGIISSIMVIVDKR